MRSIISISFFVLIFFNVYSQNSSSTQFEKGTIQIGVVVTDMEKSVKFYSDIIGMKKVGGFHLNERFGAASGLTGGLPLDVVILKLVDDPSATEWKLMSFPSLKKQSSNFIQEGTGMRYITIFVKSVTEVMQRLKENKVKLLGKTPVKLEDGNQFILFQDPDGVFIEIIGPM